MGDFTMSGKGLTKWHVAKAGGGTAVCGSTIYTGLVKAMNVPVFQRCKNTACRGHWPDYRAKGDNTIMRETPQCDRSAE